MPEGLRALPAEEREQDVLDEDVARVSPLKRANLNVLGRYSFRASTPVGGGLRPLRTAAASRRIRTLTYAGQGRAASHRLPPLPALLRTLGLAEAESQSNPGPGDLAFAGNVDQPSLAVVEHATNQGEQNQRGLSVLRAGRRLLRLEVGSYRTVVSHHST
ncbi:hypothetical protein ACQEVY_31530 [Streptomyces sp. CA-288835]|uniref:hypothetical protein n=1 Tax=Streptomyces sp. CA-288835 TaxID=3240069 RepID=UPI003D8BC069